VLYFDIQQDIGDLQLCNMSASLYEPINVYKPLAPDVGIVDGPFEHARQRPAGEGGNRSSRRQKEETRWPSNPMRLSDM
jgi:hypothetical protein